MTITSSTPELETPKKEKPMHLVERMQVKPSEELSKICHLAKDIYNKANYIMRHHFFFSKESDEMANEWLKQINNYLVSCPHEFEKVVSVTEAFLNKIKKDAKENGDDTKKGNWGWYFHKELRVSYTKLEKMLKFSPEYKRMPAQSAQQTLKKLIANWKGYRKKTIKYYEKKKKMRAKAFKKRYPKPPEIPGYKKKDGETIACFTNQQCDIEDGYLNFPGHTRGRKSLRWLPRLKVRFRGEFSQVEIVPKGGAYIIGIVYSKQKENYGFNAERVASIDLGVRNTVSMVDNIGFAPIIVKGGVVKSINQFFNKKRAKLMSIKDKQGYKHWTVRLKKLSLDRYNKLNDIFHRLSKRIVDHCAENDIGTLVIGYNATWKQEVNMGNRNNQNFVSIPFWKLIEKIRYKAELIGIKVILIEESYTSRCSFLDRERIGWHHRYKGEREKGLFYMSDGRIVNADVNAAYNIMRKAIPDVKFAEGIEDVVLHPRRANWYSVSTMIASKG